MTAPKPQNQKHEPFTHREQSDQTASVQTNMSPKRDKNSLLRMAIGYGITSALLIWTGPFNTFDLFPTVPRIIYWGLINLAGWIINTSLSIGIEHLLSRTIQPLTRKVEILGSVVAGTLSALPLALIVIKANELAHPFSSKTQAITDFPDFITLLGYIAPLTITVSMVYTLLHQNQISQSVEFKQSEPHPSDGSAGPQAPEAPETCPFFDRLPKHLGKDLLWLSSQDHYLEVKTTLGKDLILMRLGDAVKELENYSGARIHRSHWVADAAVEWVETREGRFFAHLSDESCLPISRTYRQVPSQRGWPTSRK